MGLYEFFYPHQAQAEALRSIAASMGRAARSDAATRRKTTEMDEGVGTLALVLLGLIGTLIEKGVIRRDDLLAQLGKVDAIDGVADGKVDVGQVLRALGFAPPEPEPEPEPLPEAPVSRRRRR
jgi:hypothetical protein